MICKVCGNTVPDYHVCSNEENRDYWPISKRREAVKQLKDKIFPGMAIAHMFDCIDRAFGLDKTPGEDIIQNKDQVLRDLEILKEGIYSRQIMMAMRRFIPLVEKIIRNNDAGKGA